MLTTDITAIPSETLILIRKAVKLLVLFGRAYALNCDILRHSPQRSFQGFQANSMLIYLVVSSEMSAKCVHLNLGNSFSKGAEQ